MGYTHIAAALVAASHAISAMKADARNDHFGNEYISLSAITERAKLALKAHNVTIIQSATFHHPGTEHAFGQPYISVRTIAMHDSGEQMTVSCELPLSKLDPQGGAGAITYGRRIGIAMLLGIVVDEDDDGNQASGLARAHTPLAKPATSGYGLVPSPKPSAAPAGRRVKMPFGRTKDQYIDELPDAELESAIKWAADKGKFVEFQRDATAELARRRTPAKADDTGEWDDENPPF